jgi:hypothetical protein
MKKPFYEVTWADVQRGDTVLMSLGPAILKARVERLSELPCLDGKTRILVVFNSDDLANPHGFDQADTAYVQSRI